MSHMFESGFFVKEPAWHQLGVVLEEEPKTGAEAIIMAGLDWEVFKAPLTTTVTLDNGNQSIIEVPDNFAIVRKRMDGEQAVYNALASVGKKYHPIQNIDCFNFFDRIIADGAASYETAGSLKEGRIIWILAKIHGKLPIIKDDYVEKYLLLYNSHDGTSMVTTQLSPIRVVCWNTLSMAMSDTHTNKDYKIALSHTKNVIDRMHSAAEYLGLVNDQFEHTADQYRVLAGKGIDTEKLGEYLEAVFPDPPNKVVTPKMITEQAAKLEVMIEPIKVKELAVAINQNEKNPGGEVAEVFDLFVDLRTTNNTRAVNTRAKVEELFEDGIGTDITDPTYWRAYNAITEYLDYDRDANVERGLRSNWFGQGFKLKQAALSTALQLAA